MQIILCANILIYAEEHRKGELHYHLNTDLGGQKRVFRKFKNRLLDLLPSGFKIRYYSSEDDIGILDERNRQQMHIYYIQRRFPHNLHIDFREKSFKPIFLDMLQKCFPRTKIEFCELENNENKSDNY